MNTQRTKELQDPPEACGSDVRSVLASTCPRILPPPPLHPPHPHTPPALAAPQKVAAIAAPAVDEAYEEEAVAAAPVAKAPKEKPAVAPVKASEELSAKLDSLFDE